ncbi:unnamed protein product [Rodentolepis nana]|uniref:Uncharacterized protein n=1 Tax=Rodentolepis nana TaxID=102285 RepID=A0A0R3TML4_RODNA|nr:unnamed protein product [Rodentolepis nana]
MNQRESSKVTSGDCDIKHQGLTSSAKVDETNKSSGSGNGTTDSTIVRPDASSQLEKAKEEVFSTSNAQQLVSSGY